MLYRLVFSEQGVSVLTRSTGVVRCRPLHALFHALLRRRISPENQHARFLCHEHESYLLRGLRLGMRGRLRGDVLFRWDFRRDRRLRGEARRHRSEAKRASECRDRRLQRIRNSRGVQRPKVRKQGGAFVHKSIEVAAPRFVFRAGRTARMPERGVCALQARSHIVVRRRLWSRGPQSLLQLDRVLLDFSLLPRLTLCYPLADTRQCNPAPGWLPWQCRPNGQGVPGCA